MLKDPDVFLLKYIRARDDILYIQKRYGWFLKSLFKDQPRKKARRKFHWPSSLQNIF